MMSPTTKRAGLWCLALLLALQSPAVRAEDVALAPVTDGGGEKTSGAQSPMVAMPVKPAPVKLSADKTVPKDQVDKLPANNASVQNNVTSPPSVGNSDSVPSNTLGALDPPDVDPDAVPASNTTNATNDRRLDVGQSMSRTDYPSLSCIQSYLHSPLNGNMMDLQRRYSRGSHQPVPWPGSHWPMYQDGINVRWRSPFTRSPAEKYAAAFGLNQHNFMDAVSARMGVDAASSNPVCHTSAQCPSGQVCGRRAWHAQGYCMPRWWSINHGWAAAAMLEAEPKHDVVRNGVKFRVKDIKGLVSAVYGDTPLRYCFLGARYYGTSNALDAYGRYADPAERDINPATFHIAVTNLMGRFSKSFIVDVDPTDAVWNQPVRSYEVVQATRLPPDAAAQRFFNVRHYPFNSQARSVVYVRMAFRYIVEGFDDGPYTTSPTRLNSRIATRTYEYLLELDFFSNIIGGEWVGNSKTNHPDFLWVPTGKPSANAVTSFGLRYDKVQALLQSSL